MGSPGANFNLSAGEGYRLQMSGNVNYIVVGSHDPSVVCSLDAPSPGRSKSGINDFAPPYNITTATADDLMRDIEGCSPGPMGSCSLSKIVTVSKLLRGSDSLQVWTGRMGSPGANFNLITGESYRVQMSVSVAYIPSHY
jgi:hypothetical protein